MVVSASRQVEGMDSRVDLQIPLQTQKWLCDNKEMTQFEEHNRTVQEYN